MATHLATAYPVARKEHRCDFCNGTIGKGEKYARHIFVECGIQDQHLHLYCDDAITEFTDPFDDEYSVAGVIEGVNDELREAGIKPASWVQDAVQQWAKLRNKNNEAK